MQARDQAQQSHAAMSQAAGLPSYDPTPLLLVASTEQEIQLGMLSPVRVIVASGTLRTLTLMYCRILHSWLSHPWNKELFIQDLAKKWKLFLDDR
jgi:hypothetical protein